MRDGIVGTGTSQSYLNKILTFINWCHGERPGRLTPFCEAQMTELEDSIAGLRSRVRHSRTKEFIKNLLRNAVNHPLVHVDLIKPESFMVYIEQSRNSQTGKYLLKSLYGGKRLALFHLYCLHNEIGFPEGFQSQLKVL